MKAKSMESLAFITLLAGVILLATGSFLAQGDEKAGAPCPKTVLCPAPYHQIFTATSPCAVFEADFTPAQLGAPRACLNDSGGNKHFLYTFQWKMPTPCCQITQARLTIKMKANSEGRSAKSSDAGNDGITVMYSGASVPPYSESVYSSWPFSQGQTATKTWNLTGVALDNLCHSGRLSFAVQDDTMVLSASLELCGCCLRGEPCR